MAKIKIDIDLERFDELAASAKQKAAKPNTLSGKAETEAAMLCLHAKIMALRVLKRPVPWSCKVDGVETLDGIAGIVAAVWRPSRGKPLSSHTIKAHTLRIAKERAEAKAIAAAEAEKRRAEKSIETRAPTNEKPTDRPTEKPMDRPTEQPTEQPTEKPTERPRMFQSLMRSSSLKPAAAPSPPQNTDAA